MASEEDIKDGKEKLAEDTETYEYALEVRNKDTKEFIRQVDCYNTPEEAEKSAKDLKLNDNEEVFISVITYDSNGEEIDVEVYEDAEELNERFLGPSDKTIADSKAKGLYSESAELSYGDLEDLARAIYDWYGSDMGTHFDEIQDNEETVYGDILTILETKDKEQIQKFIDDIKEADIDDKTAKSVGIETTSNLLNKLQALTESKSLKRESPQDEIVQSFFNHMNDYVDSKGTSGSALRGLEDTAKDLSKYRPEFIGMRYGDIYRALQSEYKTESKLTEKQLNILNEVYRPNIEETDVEYTDNDYMYQLVGGEYAGTYTREEAEKLPIREPELSPDDSEIRNNGGFTHRKELDNQLQFKGYLGPMWNGLDKNNKPIIRYETQEVYDMLSN